MAMTIPDTLKATRPFKWKGRDFAADEPFDAPLTTREYTRLRAAGRVKVEAEQTAMAAETKAKPRQKREAKPKKEVVEDPLE